jgi:hypothetical protein
MKNLFSTAVIATAVALLVPNNGAEAVGTVPVHSASMASAEPMPGLATNLATQEPDTKLAWIMAAGFLGVVVTRRLRGD